MILLDLPTDQAILAELGKISLKHGHLDHMLKMLVVTFTGAAISDVLDATRYEGSRTLRERIRKLAKSKLGDGKALVQLQALLERCARASEKRNNLVHSLWGYELDNEHKIQSADHTWQSGPSMEDLKKLFNELDRLTQEIIFARLEDFLFEDVKK